MRYRPSHIAALFGTFALAANAMAVPIEVDFSGNMGRESSITFTEAGVTVFAQGGTNAGGLGARDVQQNGEGLGVTSGFLENNNIDGFGPDEYLNLVISGAAPQYRLLRVDFENVDFLDRSALIVDGVQLGFGLINSALGISGASADSSIPGDGDETRVFLDVAALDIVGSTFRFGDGLAGSGSSLDFLDNFRVQRIFIEAVASVPDSGATLALFGTGLMCVGGWKRRQSKRGSASR